MLDKKLANVVNLPFVSIDQCFAKSTNSKKKKVYKKLLIVMVNTCCYPRDCQTQSSYFRYTTIAIVLDLGLSGSGLSPGQGHFSTFPGKAKIAPLYTELVPLTVLLYSLFIQMSTGEFFNPVLD